MPRYALLIEYDGTAFSGWQRQSGGVATMQGAIEAALARLETGIPSIAAAGRTDAGVHALGQVAHCDLSKTWDPFRLREALNHHLRPARVAINAVAHVAEDWHARFSAVERQYEFRLLNRRAPAALARDRVWHVAHPLRLEPMQDAAKYLIGRHDFTTFRASECQAESPVKTLDRLDIEAIDGAYGRELRFHLRARSFLHSQVRSLVGTLERVGAGAWPPSRVKEALDARDRAACGPVCPPSGLYLSKVTYPIDPFAAPKS